jgi:penicillin amidase
MADPVQSAPRPSRHWLRRILLTLLGLVIVVVGLAYWRLRAPLPDVTGSLKVDGLQAAVEIIRDADHVPHIRAANEPDAQFALGYVHAQERLWQMELQRRVAWGRLSEFAGPDAVETDRLMRTIGIGRAATATWPQLAPDARAAIESYVAGINAFLATHRGGSLPVEFAILRITPEPFRGEDVVAWYKTMAWLLSTNWHDELLRLRMATRVGDEGADQLIRSYTAEGPIVLPPDAAPALLPATPLPNLAVPVVPAPVIPERQEASPTPTAKEPATVRGDAALAELAAKLERAALEPLALPLTGGSNNWVVAGKRTVSGKPLLANDPHLAGSMPGIWYLAHVSGGRLDVTGATIPGLPGVIIGHNARVAWGITAFLADVQDFYVEHVNTADQAEFQGAWEPMRVIRDVIKVRGAADVPLRVRITRHGPLLSDVVANTPFALALRWTGHDAADQSGAALLKVNLATSWDEFNAALSLTHGPVLNFVYADVDGNIGYVGPGALPVRPAGEDGRRPMPGWTGEHEWRGYIHDSEWPRAFNPQRGYLASANNKVTPDDYPFPLSTAWESGYRAARITELIESTPRHGVDDFVQMQADHKTAQAAVVVPFLLRARPLDDESRDAMERLRGWDGTMAAESPEAALYDAWYTATVRGMFEDDLGPALFDDYWRIRNTPAKAVDHLMRQGETSWCDDVRTAEPETCATLLGHTLRRALDDMGERQGTRSMAKWRWDRVNEAVFPHAVFEHVGLLRRWFSRRVPAGGNAFTITPVMPIKSDIYVSSYRQIVNMASLDDSLFVIPAGQSGHVWSPQYDDLLPKWRAGDYVPMRFSREAVDASQASRLTLQPR